jgi:hypothetical protein
VDLSGTLGIVAAAVELLSAARRIAPEIVDAVEGLIIDTLSLEGSKPKLAIDADGTPQAIIGPTDIRGLSPRLARLKEALQTLDILEEQEKALPPESKLIPIIQAARAELLAAVVADWTAE